MAVIAEDGEDHDRGDALEQRAHRLRPLHPAADDHHRRVLGPGLEVLVPAQHRAGHALGGPLHQPGDQPVQEPAERHRDQQQHQDGQGLGHQPGEQLVLPVLAHQPLRQVGPPGAAPSGRWRRCGTRVDALMPGRYETTPPRPNRVRYPGRVTNHPHHPAVRRAARVLALVPALLVTFATATAFAEPPEQWEDNTSVSSLHVLAVIVLIPVGLFVLISLLVYLPSMSRGTAYHPSEVWRGQPEWFGGPRTGAGASRPASSPRGRQRQPAHRRRRPRRWGRRRRDRARGRTGWRKWQLVTPSAPRSGTRSTRRSGTPRQLCRMSSRSTSAAPRARPGRSPSPARHPGRPGPLGADARRPGRPHRSRWSPARRPTGPGRPRGRARRADA